MIRTKQLADKLGVPVATVYAWIHRKQIPHVRLTPRLVVFEEQEIEAWLTARRIAPAARKP